MDFSRKINDNKKKVFPVMMYKALADMNLLEILDEDKLGLFLKKV